MAFDSLSDKLAGVFKKLRSRGKLSEADVKTAMREVRLALLEADVNYKVVKKFNKNKQFYFRVEMLNTTINNYKDLSKLYLYNY